MRKAMAILAVIGFSILFVGVYARLHSGRPATAGGPDPAETSSSEKRENVVVKHVFAFEPPPATPPPAAVAGEPSPPADPIEKTPAQYEQELESAFRMDAPADRKASELSTFVSSALRDPAARGVTVDRVDCHATRCRLEVRFDDAASDKMVMSQFFELLSAKGADTQGLGFVIPSRAAGDDGKIRATIHVFRSDGPSG
jgi:hypothetical protein